MATTVKIEGLRELARALEQFPQRLGQNVLRGAVNAGARVIRDEAKTQAPVETGTLKRSIYTKRIREESGTLVQTYFVGVRRGKQYRSLTTKTGKDRSMDAYYAPFVEYGHFTRRSGGRLRFTNRGQRNNQQLSDEVQSGQVRWIPAQPFMRPAWDARKDDALKAIADYLMRRIPEEVRKGKG